MRSYYQDDSVTLLHGDALEQLRTLEDDSINCCVTSPPYFGLRDYGVAGQYGLEASPAEYVETMRALFAEVRRVLADDGTCWINIGDRYNSAASGQNGTHSTTITGGRHDRMAGRGTTFRGMPTKNLFGIPWRVAFALQDDGWTLRNDIIWNKPNAMPESVTDRLSTRYEHLFLFSKSQRYWFDLNPIREALTRPEALTEGIIFGGAKKAADLQTGSSARRTGGTYGKRPPRQDMNPQSLEFGGAHRDAHTYGRNPGDVWTIPTVPFPGSHFAAFPPEIPRRCIAAGCKPGGTVLDPFHGSGTTGMVAQKLGRRYIGIDLSAEYLDLSLRTRLADGTLPFEVTA